MEPFVFRYEGALIATRGTDTNDAVLENVNEFSLRELTKDEFAVFSLDLCHNQIDKHHSRFPDEELEKISTMVPGRPLLERHDVRGSLPRGRFYRSELVREGDRLSVRPDVYVLRTHDNADFILNIEGGVYRETSIGFSFGLPECSICNKDLRRCDHVPGRSYGEKRCHYIMRDVQEVIEGSVVSSGSQGTSFVSQAARVLPPVDALATARETFHRPIELNSCPLWATE